MKAKERDVRNPTADTQDNQVVETLLSGKIEDINPYVALCTLDAFLCWADEELIPDDSVNHFAVALYQNFREQFPTSESIMPYLFDALFTMESSGGTLNVAPVLKTDYSKFEDINKRREAVNKDMISFVQDMYDTAEADYLRTLMEITENG